MTSTNTELLEEQGGTFESKVLFGKSNRLETKHYWKIGCLCPYTY